MSSKPKVSITWNHQNLNKIKRRTLEGLLDLAYDIAAQARENAPYVSGALRNSIRVEDDWRGDRIYVRAGGVVSSGRLKGVGITRTVDYAWKVEQKSSSPHYMERAQKTIMTGDYIKKYFGGITK